MDVEDLVDRLGAFGVEGNEALAYYHLSRLGSSSAAEIARAADLPRTDVYRLMDELEQHGLVERTLESPTKFVPQPVDEGLDRLLAERARETRELDTLRDDLVEVWPRPQGRAAPEEERVSIQKGRKQIEGLMNRVMAAAEEHLLVACPKRSLARFESMGVLETLAERTAAGVDAKIVTEVDDTNLDTARAYAEHCQVRHVALPAYLQMVVQDTSTIVLFVAVDPLTSVSGSGLTAIKLTSTDFILAQEALFDGLWERGFSLEQRVEELETGRPAQQARVVRGRWPMYEKIEELLHRADDVVRLALGGLSLAHPRAERVADLLSRLEDDGVEVRVLDADGGAGEIGVNRREAGAWPHPVTLVVDETEVLRVLDGGEDPGLWSLWSTLEHDVQRERERFDDAWDAGG